MHQPILAFSVGAALMFGGIVLMLVLWVAIIVAFYFRKPSGK